MLVRWVGNFSSWGTRLAVGDCLQGFSRAMAGVVLASSRGVASTEEESWAWPALVPLPAGFCFLWGANSWLCSSPAPDLRGHAVPRVYAGGVGTVVGRRSRVAPGRSRLVKNGLESPPGERGPEELQAAAGQSLELRGASWGQNARATWGAAARGGHMDRAEPPADRTSSPYGRPPRCPSPEADGPLPRADSGSPWEVDGSTEGGAEGSAACPGGQSQCQGCTVLRAQLEAVQEELQVARGTGVAGYVACTLRGTSQGATAHSPRGTGAGGFGEAELRFVLAVALPLGGPDLTPVSCMAESTRLQWGWKEVGALQCLGESGQAVPMAVADLDPGPGPHHRVQELWSWL